MESNQHLSQVLVNYRHFWMLFTSKSFQKNTEDPAQPDYLMSRLYNTEKNKETLNAPLLGMSRVNGEKVLTKGG